MWEHFVSDWWPALQAWFWAQSKPTDLFTAIAAIAGAIFFVLNWGFSEKQKKLQAQQLENGLKLQDLQLRDALEGDAARWGGRAIEALAQAHYLLLQRKQTNDSEFRDIQSRCLAQLSALLDEGRMFFPNVEPGAFGTDRHGAFQGLRQPILDALALVLFELQALDYRDQDVARQTEIVETSRRVFVSELVASLNSRARADALRALQGRSSEPDKGWRDLELPVRSHEARVRTFWQADHPMNKR